MSMQYTPSYGVGNNSYLNPFYGLGGSNNRMNQYPGFGGQPQPLMANQSLYGRGATYTPSQQYQRPQLPPGPQSQFIPPQDQSRNMYQNIITNNYYIQVPVPVYIQAPSTYPQHQPPGCYQCDSYLPERYPNNNNGGWGGMFGGSVMNTMMMIMSLFMMLGNGPNETEVETETETEVEAEVDVELEVELEVETETEESGPVINAAPAAFKELSKTDLNYIIEQAGGSDGKLSEAELNTYISALESGVIQNSLQDEINELLLDLQGLDYDYGGYSNYEAERLEADIERLEEKLHRLDRIEEQAKSLQSVFGKVAAFDGTNSTISTEDVTDAAKAIDDDNKITDLELGFESLETNINKSHLFQQISANTNYSLSDLESKLSTLNGQIAIFENDASLTSQVNALKDQRAALEFIIDYFNYAQEDGVINRTILNTLSSIDGNANNISLEDLVG